MEVAQRLLRDVYPNLNSPFEREAVERALAELRRAIDLVCTRYGIVVEK